MIVINYNGDIISLPRDAKEYYLEATEIELKTLIALCSNSDIRKEDNISKKLAKILGCREKLVKEAIQYWCEAKVISVSKEEKVDIGEFEMTTSSKDNEEESREEIKKERTAVTYTGEELERLLDENGGARRKLLKACQEIVGKVFTPHESEKIVALSDSVGLEDEYILLLAQYCVGKNKRSVSYIEKVGNVLSSQGIDDYEKLDEYVKNEEKTGKRDIFLKKMFGVGFRSFTKEEKENISKWYDSYLYDDEIITKAFEVTVKNTSNNVFSFKYMNSVLDNWYRDGYRTLEDICNAEEANKVEKKKTMKSVPSGKDGNDGAGGSFSTEDFVSAALERAKNNLHK